MDPCLKKTAGFTFPRMGARAHWGPENFVALEQSRESFEISDDYFLGFKMDMLQTMPSLLR